MSQINKFAVFILSNNRPENVKTINALNKSNYNGDIVIVLDDQDKTFNEYKKNYKDIIIYKFNKNDALKITDTADNTKNMKAVVYARNMCWSIARELGYDYFLVLDDDYTTFQYRSNFNGIYKPKQIKNLNKVISIYLEFLKQTDIKCIAMSQGGDFIGGYGNKFGTTEMLDRKCMNSFFCRTDKPFSFYGLINEDVNCYTLNASRGDIYFTTSGISLEQTVTQSNDGGLTTIYLELGTYVKSFYSVIFHPSSIVVKDMGNKDNRRLHHSIEKNFTYPKILNEKYKKV